MKKIFVGMMAFAALFATSCQNELELAPVAGETSVVSFRVGTPELATRAYSDGQTATVLQYAVYDEEGKILGDLTKEDAVINGSTNVNLELVTGNTYSVIFWAAAKEAPYSVDFTTKTVTVDYTDAISNDENRDAFYKYHTFTVAGAQTETIELKRPFAQLNIGTGDYTAAKESGYVPTMSAVKVTNIYAALNLTDGTVSEETAVEFTANTIPAIETFPVAGYEYLAMNYLLVAADKEVVDIEFTYSDGSNAKTRKVGSVPVQRNHRTNIYGNLLTSDVEVNVEINPEYQEPDYDQSLLPWDGTADTSWYNETDNEFTLTDPQQLAGLAELVDGGETFEGKTIKLDVDMNLYVKDANGEPICFDPIGSYRSDTSFKGTFDGQNHTISNLSQNTWALDNGYYYTDCGLGLFGAVEDAAIKNLIMDNASISGESAICGIVAAVAQNTTFENITVKNSECADYQYYSGGIVGWASGEDTFVDCNVDASTTVAAQWGDFDNSTGGVIGGASGSAKILMKNCNVACRIDAYNDVTSSYQWYAYRRCGMLIGNPGKTKDVDGRTYADAPQLTCENVTVTYGEWADYTYCEFAGTNWPYVRVQAGISNSAYSNPRYGHPTDANGNTVVDDSHVHNDGEDHHISCPFDQLYGGGQGVYGTRTHEGVTISYHYSLNKTEASTAADVIAAIKAGQNVKLAADVNVGTTQLALDNVKIDLNGHTLTTQMTHGGISLKNGASIKNGVIEHSSTVAAIKAFNVGEISDVTIRTTCATENKTVTGIAVQQGGYVGAIRNVTIEGISQGIEVGYQATVDLIEGVSTNMSTNGTANGIGLVINGGKVGLAKNSTFKGNVYGVTMHLKGVFAVGLEMENCVVEGTTASVYAWDEKGTSNTSGSLTFTYDASTKLEGPFIWDFEEECQSVVALNKPE